MKLRLWQTPTSKKENRFHIADQVEEKRVGAYCNNAYWNKDYSPRKKPEIFPYEGQDLCPSCVGQAYISGNLGVFEIETRKKPTREQLDRLIELINQANS